MVGALRADLVTNLDECVPAVMGLRAHVRFRSCRDKLSLTVNSPRTSQGSQPEFLGNTRQNPNITDGRRPGMRTELSSTLCAQSSSERASYSADVNTFSNVVLFWS